MHDPQFISLSCWFKEFPFTTNLKMMLTLEKLNKFHYMRRQIVQVEALTLSKRYYFLVSLLILRHLASMRSKAFFIVWFLMSLLQRRI